jgi:hypothetical protein
MSTELDLAYHLLRCIQIFAEDIFPAEQYVEMKHAERALEDWIKETTKQYERVAEFKAQKRDRKTERSITVFLASRGNAQRSKSKSERGDLRIRELA